MSDITVGTYVRMPPQPYGSTGTGVGKRGQVVDVQGVYARVQWTRQRGGTKFLWFLKDRLTTITRGSAHDEV